MIAEEPKELLRRHLRSDAAPREAAVMLMATIVCVAGGGLGLFFRLSLPNTPRNLIFAEVGAVGLSIYCAAMAGVLRRGWYHPAISWVNVTLEASAIPLVIVLLSLNRSAEVAFTTPMQVVWGAALVMTAFRADPRLSLYAGGYSAALFLLLYAGFIRPRLPPDAGLEFRPVAMLIRAALVVVCGLGGWTLSRYLVRRAEAALTAVREQDLFGKYLMHEQIGQGGMAEVYRATYCPEGGFRKPVAIKRVLPECAASTDFQQMFLEEARLGALLNHPNIVQVLDCGRFRGTYMLAMEYVEGASLRRLIASHGPLPIAAVAYIGAELACGLDYIHERQGSDGRPLRLVHRDVNPPNVLLSIIGEVKLGDFGVALAQGRPRGGTADRAMGKLAYMPPELFAGEPYDGRADLYCLGLTLYEALTGRRVFTGTVEDIRLQLSRGSPIPAVRTLRPDIPEELDALVTALLERVPGRRPAHGAAVRDRLLQLRGELAPYPNGRMLISNAVRALSPLAEGASRQATTAKAPPSEDVPTRTLPRLAP